MSSKVPESKFPSERRRYPEGQQELTLSMAEARTHFTKMLEVFRKHNIEFTKDTRILEIGTGKGKYLKFMIRRGNPIVGIDSNPRLNPLDKEEFGTQVYEGNIEDIRIEPGTFGLVVGEGVFDRAFYNQHQSRMIEQIAQVLKPGGIFYPGHHEPDIGNPAVERALKDNFYLASGEDYFKVYRKK